MRRHLDLVYSAALRQVGGDAHRAQDVAQVVFVALARKAPALTRHPVLAGWLYTATQHAAAKAVRTEERRRRREEEAHAMGEILNGDYAAEETPWAEVRPVLDAAMRELDERDREAVLLRFFAMRPFAEIGAALRVGEDAARMRVERALEKLRVRLKRHGVTSTATALAVLLETQAVSAAPVGMGVVIASGACAAAVAPAGVTALVVQLMANTKLVCGGAGLLACLVGTLVVRETISRRETEATLLAATHAREVQAAGLRAMASRVAEAERAAAAAASSLEKRRAEIAAASARAAAAMATASVSKDSPADPTKKGNAFMARHPAVKVALDAWADARVDGKWTAFYRARGLTPAQIAEFRLLTRAIAFAPGPDPDGSLVQLNSGADAGKRTREQRLRVLLGEEGFAEYRYRAETENARAKAGEIAGALSLSDSALTGPQYAQLIEALHRHRVPPEAASQASANFDWAALARDATGFLLPVQLAVLDGVRAQDAFQVQWNRAPNPLNDAHEAAKRKK